jgi:hypothetical protein
VKTFVTVAVIVVAGLFAWKKLWSNDARIESAYQACMTKIGKGTVTIDIKSPLPPGASDYIGAGEQSGAAVCESLRKFCRSDFNSKPCEALRYAF